MCGAYDNIKAYRSATTMNLRIPSWMLFLAVLVIIILIFMWPPEPDPPDTQPWKDSLAKKDLELKALRQRQTLYLDTIRAMDSIRAAESAKYKATISRLRGDLKNIDTKTATAPKLDSIINELYP